MRNLKVMSALALAGILPLTGCEPAPTFYVAPNGSDSNPGTIEQPWKTLNHALRQMDPGEVLNVREGLYSENVHVSASQITPGTAESPITIKAHPGETPEIRGLFWLTNPSYWKIQNLEFTWNNGNSSSDHMVKLRGGTGWELTGSRLSGARSFAALLVGMEAKNFKVSGNVVHDTYPSNGLNQDHLIYVDNGSGNGVIERNLLYNALNGRGVKLGPGSLSSPGTDNITVRYNTIVNTTGPSNVQFSGNSSNNVVERNIMVDPQSQRANVTVYEIQGTNNVVRNNVGHGGARVADFISGRVINGGGNQQIDPDLDQNFAPQNPSAQGYGHLAPAGS